MRRRKKTFIADLTPLLDVVFILLFLVMMVTARQQTERTRLAEAAAEEAEDEARQARREADEAREKTAELERLLTDARVVDVSLADAPEGNRQLTVTAGAETSSYVFGWDEAAEAERFLSRELTRAVQTADKEAPVFLIFRYDAAQIYESDYRMVSRVFGILQENHSNVYLQIREAGDER